MESDDFPTNPPPTSPSKDPKWVRNILFFILFFLIVLSYSNLIVAVILATIINLLSISIFDHLSHDFVTFCIKIAYRITRLPFGPWLKSHFRFNRFVTNILTLLVTVIVLGLTILRPTFANLFGGVNDAICLRTALPWFSCNSGLGVSTLPDDVRIGLITDNTFGPFDLSPFNQDEENVEKLIFGENKQACAGQHITLIVVTMLSRTLEDPQSDARIGVQSLEGDYLAQHSYNATSPTLPLCLALANLGTSGTANVQSPVVKACHDCYSMPQVLHRIAQFVRVDSSVRGIVGLPFSQQVNEALQIITENEPSLVSLPIISSTASSDDFSNIPNFYRIELPNQNQAAVMAQFFCSHLVTNQSPPTVAILDTNDPYSGNIAQDFQIYAKCLNAAKTSIIHYTNGDNEQIQSAIDQAHQDDANFIFFPGYDQDMDTVEAQIYTDWSGSASSVTVLGGDGINDVNATTHYSYTRIYSVNFDQPLLRNDRFVQNFIQDDFIPVYTIQTPIMNSNYFLMPQDTASNIDAIKAFTYTLQVFQGGTFTQSDFNKALWSTGFQGETGPLEFQGGKTETKHISDRALGALIISCYDTKHILHVVGSYSTRTDDVSAQEDSSLPYQSSCTS